MLSSRIINTGTAITTTTTTTTATTVLIVLLSSCLTDDVAFAVTSDIATTRCKHDVDCPKNTNQFCRGDVCYDCVNCGQFHRNTGLGSSCLRDEIECGSCIDGYREVINGHPPYGKQCVVPRSWPPYVGKFGNDNNKRGSKSRSESATPSEAAEIGITVGVVIVTAAIAVGLLAALYHHMRKKQQQATTTTTINGGGATPRIIEMATMPIAASRQRTVTRRTDSSDEDYENLSWPTETTAMAETDQCRAAVELNSKQPEMSLTGDKSRSRSSSTSSSASTPGTGAGTGTGTGTNAQQVAQA